MLQVLSALEGFVIEATDGKIGSVVDFLFDDASWKVRWIVVDCGTWLTGRKVLIHPGAVSYSGLEAQRFEVKLTKAQVEGSPELTRDQPVSQQMEAQLYSYYGWDALGNAPYIGGISGAMSSPLLAAPFFGVHGLEEGRGDVPMPSQGDAHLRSFDEIIGYDIHALDGEIGHVENFLMNDEDWSFPYIIVDTSNWWFGKRVLIANVAVTGIDWSDRRVKLDVSRELVKKSPEWDPLSAFDEVYADQLHSHYGWPGSSA